MNIFIIDFWNICDSRWSRSNNITVSNKTLGLPLVFETRFEKQAAFVFLTKVLKQTKRLFKWKQWMGKQVQLFDENTLNHK